MSLYNNESKNEKVENIKKNKKLEEEILKNLLSTHLNIRLSKLESSSSTQISDLKKASKNFKEFINNIQELSKNIEAEKNKEKKEENKENNINNNLVRYSMKKSNELNNSINSIKNQNTPKQEKKDLRNRSNTLGFSKFLQLKKIATEVNLNKTNKLAEDKKNNINNNKKVKMKSPEKNKEHKIIFLNKELTKNNTPKKTKNNFIENSIKIPKTEKIPKKMTDKTKKVFINKAIKNRNKNNNNILRTSINNNNNFYDKKLTDINNINSMKSSFSSKKEKKIKFNEIDNNSNNMIINNNFADVQNIVKLVDNVHQNIEKILNNNKSKDFSSRSFVISSDYLNNRNHSNNNSNKKSEFTLKKKYLSKKERIFRINVLEIFKKDKKILANILNYLTNIEIISFYSINNFFNKSRILLLDKKKEKLLSQLNLKKDETIDNKINEIIKVFPEEKLKNQKKFEISEDTKNKIKEINEKKLLEKSENDDDNINIIVYRILFVFLGEEKIYMTLTKNFFWKKCFNYFKENCDGNIGELIIDKIHMFKFGVKEFNEIEDILKKDKKELINKICNNTDLLIIPLIKEALEYFGIIYSPDKTEGNLMIKNLRKNQIIINYLNNLKVRYFLSKYNEDDDED